MKEILLLFYMQIKRFIELIGFNIQENISNNARIYLVGLFRILVLCLYAVRIKTFIAFHLAMAEG